MSTRYLVGIDLGTTNSALAYIDLQEPKRGAAPVVHPFRMPQLVAPGETAPRELLPSFLYLPGSHDLPAGATALPWDTSPTRERGDASPTRERGDTAPLPHGRGSDAPPKRGSDGAPKDVFAVGEFARNHGARIPGRLVTSAKSWLCHAGVDRSAPLLPWSAPPDVERLSPVEASMRYLRHMADAWNHVMAQGKPAHRLENLPVVLTVPASFDDMARTLTVEAARRAGLENATLLEEPQAAFYCWLATHSQQEANRLKADDQCLVIDVGGGTTDFSLIQAVEQEGELGFVRQAVGDHLLLGGDNMDLALAKFVETKLPAAGRLDAAQYGTLTQACRQAKETLLQPDPPASYSVTVMGRGRQVIGGLLHTSLAPDEVRKTLLDGFFPTTPFDAEPERGRRTGLHEMGLPYVADPAITKHLASFLRKHQHAAPSPPTPLPQGEGRPRTPSPPTPLPQGEGRLPHPSPPTPLPPGQGVYAHPACVLFNGGVFQPAILRDRIIDVLASWFGTSQEKWSPLVLTNPSLDLAVALGAAYFAWLRHSGGKRIGGGIARSYYLGVQGDAQAEGKTTLVCIVPQHLEEGQEIVLAKPEMELALGQPVLFPLYTSTIRGDDKAGDILQVAPTQLLQLPPLHTILRGGKRSGTRSVPVILSARCTEIGTLELHCVARDGNNRWRLEFNVRDIVKEPEETAGEGDDAKQALTDVWPEDQVQAAGKLIRGTYLSAPLAPGGRGVGGEGVNPHQLTKTLEAALDAGRDKWPSGLCRRLWDFLAETADRRRQSPGHLSRWYNLVGFCLRPGFGDPLDRFRVEQLWKIMHAPRSTPLAPGGRGAKTMGPPEGGADFWIMWRRVAGGLNLQLQNTLLNRLRSVLLPAKAKNVAKPAANELAEMWRAAAALERIDVKMKEQLGPPLLKLCKRSPVPPYAFWALTRLGARVLLYGPLNAVVHPQTAQAWLDAIAGFEPGNASERMAWAFCMAQLARRSGQRALDIDDSHRETVLAALRTQSVPGHWIQMVEEVAELESDEQSQMFGEALPVGLRIIQSAE
ncbi:MAG: hsp70 family protein [Gemmataceae bacterium]|nr:hsp70 family protein [Gemmataceae bacterium]